MKVQERLGSQFVDRGELKGGTVAKLDRNGHTLREERLLHMKLRNLLVDGMNRTRRSWAF